MSGASERASGASKRASKRASGPVFQSVFLAVLDHSVTTKLYMDQGIVEDIKYEKNLMVTLEIMILMLMKAHNNETKMQKYKSSKW